MAESFKKTLKGEEVYGAAYRDLAEARRAVGAFIDQVYNRLRLHSALNYLSPTEFEESRPGPWAAARQPTGQAGTNCP